MFCLVRSKTDHSVGDSKIQVKICIAFSLKKCLKKMNNFLIKWNLVNNFLRAVLLFEFIHAWKRVVLSVSSHPFLFQNATIPDKTLHQQILPIFGPFTKILHAWRIFFLETLNFQPKFRVATEIIVAFCCPSQIGLQLWENNIILALHAVKHIEASFETEKIYFCQEYPCVNGLFPTCKKNTFQFVLFCG